MLDETAFAQLDALLVEMGTLILPDEVPRLVQIDIVFHSLLIAGADAPKVCELWAGLNGRMSVLFLNALENRHASIDDVVALHRVLLNGLRTGDLSQAQEAVVTHYVGESDFRHPDSPGNSISTLSQSVAARLANRSDADT